MFADGLTRSNGLKYLFLFFILSVVIRIPNLNRPLSKHHEFNTAVILMGIESWQQAGGASVFNFVPLLNYQQKGDYSYTKQADTDDKGNFIYMSFGPGWYIIPYLFFKVFNMLPNPLNLQILNLITNAVTVFILFLLLERLWISYPARRKYASILISCIVFLFSPNILWFLGNGYVCTGIMLPFALTALVIFFDLLKGKRKMNLINITALILVGIITIYIDWFGVFLYASLALVSLLLFRRNNNNIIILSAACGITIIAGIGIIILQFSSYVGFEQVFTYLKLRFTDRSIAKQEGHLPEMFLRIAEHFLTSYLPVIFLIGFICFNNLKKRINRLQATEKIFTAVLVVALIPFNVILLEWSYEHDFSLIPYSILLSFLTGSILLRATLDFNKNIIISVFLLIATAQYYFINRPGKLSQNGSPYSAEMDLGNLIKRLSLPPYKIFTNLPPSAVLEYYAKRTMKFAPDKKAAEKQMKELNIREGIWIEGKNNGMVEVEPIKD